MTAYLDWAATAIPDPEIYRRAAEKAAEAWANPSSQHREGKKAAESLENARRLCASVLGVPPETVFFTSGGTEADQIPLLSLLRRPAPGSAVISAIEHPAVRNQAEVLKKFGWTILPVNPDADGFITPEAVLAAIREDTAFAAVMCVNNETGAIQPVEEIAAALRKMLEKIPAKKLWVNPDCGLKTRGTPETEASLRNLVQAAVQVRAEEKQVRI